ncbi:response regulator [Aridibaculum aurantiacum]|uniref:response regulator n=1 Tax=Aridibaculum aurantiacum TaxID=2810307 RepID=UPI001A9684B7|nr:response regulator [Aridibaculum aurantiacum]
MNKMFKRISLTGKLMLIAIFPILLLVFFAIQIYKEKSERLEILNNYIERIEQSAAISNVVDVLQVERRLSFGYSISRSWRTEMLMERKKTDEAIQKMVQFEWVSSSPKYTFLDSLQQIRAAIDDTSITPNGVMTYYTNTIFRVNTLNIITGGNITYLNPVNADLMSQKLMMEMITYLGIVRASIYYSLYTKYQDPAIIDQVRSIYLIYNSYIREIQDKGSPAANAALTKLLSTGEPAAISAYIENGIQNQRLDTTWDAEKWWTTSAKAVDQLKHLQRELLNNVSNGILHIYETEKTNRDRSVLFLILSIAAVLGIVSYTITTITKTLNELNVAAKKIATGATGIQLDVASRDVIASLADSIVYIDKNNQKLAVAADAIGSGNFDVEVVARSSEDILGNAVLHMKNDLQMYHKENEQKLWVHEGIAAVNDAIRGQKTVQVLSADVLNALVSFIGAEVGLMYTAYEKHLQFAAAYAVSDTTFIPSQIGYGETLIGQVAQNKQLMQLKNIPTDFIKIRTGTGEAMPTNILLVPLVHNDVLEAVVEIGCLQETADKTIAFLEQVIPAIALAIQGAKSRARLQELFEQVQSQAEELQAQHRDLENINAELETHTERLQASEEELKVQQEELLQANQELEERSRLLEERNQLIVEKNIEIQQKAEELELSSKYKSEFLANMSHELRTPLNSVLLLSRLLAENNDHNLSAEQVEYARVIQSSGNGLLSLIDEILDLSKIEAGKMELEYQPVLVQEIVQDIRSLFAPLAKEKGLDFNVHVEPQLPSTIETDKQRLEQVLKNLLSNALKFTTQGSVSFSVSTLKDNHAFICFSVKDTGIGIPKEKHALIFEAFQQADGSTRRKFGGTGLGLSISRELTRLLGGEIKLASEPGKGTEFTIYIPIEKVAAAALGETESEDDEKQASVQAPVFRKGFRVERIPEALPDDRAHVSPSEKTLLIIEDDTAFAKALVEYTRQKGYKALVAVRGDEGIELAQKYKPMGILLDIQLPVKDGWEVMEELKSNPITRHIPVHMMSSLEAKKESLVKGAVDFINKPVAFEQMQDVFKKIEHVLTKDPKKVLILEENKKHAKALAYFLETFNVNTEISASIDEGVDVLQREGVDCVILDMGVPDHASYQTLEQVKKTPGLENLPIIIFTGRNVSKPEEMRIKQYADSIVLKTAQSYQRIIDEVSLFLHLVEESKNDSGAGKYKRLGALNEVLAGKKILVTDDDVRNIFSLTKALEIHNMEVYTAVDGREALKRLEEHPDMNVVLMDIMMPEMDGYEAMRKIRAQKAFQHLPIIAVTAKAMTGDREKCIQAGASDYISKPVDIDQLTSLLRVWLYDKSI